MTNVAGDFLVALDIDMIPSRNSYQEIKSLLSPYSQDVGTNTITITTIAEAGIGDSNPKNSFVKMQKNRHVFALPVFGVHTKNNENKLFKKMVPKDKNDLLAMVNGNHTFAWAEPFHAHFPPAQGATNYNKWINDASTILLSKNDNSGNGYFYPIQYKFNFEPYALAYKPGIPRYWETFRGFYYNQAFGSWSWTKLDLNSASFPTVRLYI